MKATVDHNYKLIFSDVCSGIEKKTVLKEILPFGVGDYFYDVIHGPDYGIADRK